MANAILFLLGAQRGEEARPENRCTTLSSLPSIPAMCSEELPSSDQRTNVTCRPSGDQSPNCASLTTLDGSPPIAGTRKSALLRPEARVNRIMLPSRENRGKSSGPSVSRVSYPVTTSLTHICFVPLRSELKQMRFPSADVLAPDRRRISGPEA